MPKFIGPEHPWFHPELPVEHTSYGEYGDSVAVHGGDPTEDPWHTPRVYLKHDNHYGRSDLRVDYSSGGDVTGIQNIEKHHKAHMHAMKIARDMAQNTVARAAVRRRDIPMDMLHSLKNHPDHMVARIAKNRLQMMPDPAQSTTVRNEA